MTAAGFRGTIKEICFVRWLIVHFTVTGGNGVGVDIVLIQPVVFFFAIFNFFVFEHVSLDFCRRSQNFEPKASMFSCGFYFPFCSFMVQFYAVAKTSFSKYRALSLYLYQGHPTRV